MPRKSNTKEFIEKAHSIHGDKYDYSKVNYINNTTKVCIICHEKDEHGQEHGEFWQRPHNHIQAKQGCPKCNGTFLKTTEQFIQEAKFIHGNKFNYNKAKYVNNYTPIEIICHKHGSFWQKPVSHLQGQGCPKCANKNVTTKDFIEKAKRIHGERYDYSKTEYKNSSTKIKIICPTHGIFLQEPSSHLNGRGCPYCSTSKLEIEIQKELLKNDLDFLYNEYPKFLNGLQLDFYLPKYHVAIECQGIQHFVKSHFFEPLSVVQERDKRKFLICKENNIKLLYFSNLGINYPYKVYENKEELIREIINGK